MSVSPQANQQQQSGLPSLPPVATAAGIGSEVDAEISAATAPLEREANQLGLNETRAIQDLNQLFAGIMPFVAGSAQRVAQTYGATNEAQQSIFAEAWARLNGLQSERAGRAQQLAQQIGAPIPMDMFSAGIDLERMAFVPEAAGELLKSSTIGQAGVQQAEAFAGRVFPLQHVRLDRQTHNFYQDQVKSLRSQIATLKSQKPGMVNERLRQRQLEDYEMRLARAEAEFDRYSTKRGLKLEEDRLRLQEEQWRREAGLTRRGQDISDKNAKTQKQLNNRTFVNAKKQDIVSLSVALATGGKQVIQRRQLIRQPDGSIKSVIIDDEVNTSGIKSPTRLLNMILAQTGIQKGQKELYGFAVKQVIQALKINGIQGMPADPSKWEKWWNQRMKKGKGKGKPIVTGPPSTGVLDQPQPPGTPSGGSRYTAVSPTGAYVEKVGNSYYIVHANGDRKVITKNTADRHRSQWGRP